jgi:Na+/H+ antiporter NhaB
MMTVNVVCRWDLFTLPFYGSFKGFVIICGIGLALSLHFFKMLIRLIGEGWLTGIITVLEVVWCIVTILLAVFVQPLAIVCAILLGAAAVMGIRRRQRQHHRDEMYKEGGDDETMHVTKDSQVEPDDALLRQAEKGGRINSNYVQMSERQTQ